MTVGVMGLGFTGMRIREAARALGDDVRAWSARTVPPGAERLDARDPDAPERLDLAVADGALDAVVVTFPPEPVPPAFWDVLARKARRVVLLGTTGSLARTGARREPLDEATPLVPGHVRTAAEARVQSLGGAVLRLAGLYGPGRNPAAWVRAGRLAPEDRQVNLVHGDDVARAVRALLDRPALRPAYVLADGQEHTAAQLVAFASARGFAPPEAGVAGSGSAPRPPAPDGVVVPRAFLEDAGPFAFRDAWAEIDALCRAG